MQLNIKETNENNITKMDSSINIDLPLFKSLIDKTNEELIIDMIMSNKIINKFKQPEKIMKLIINCVLEKESIDVLKELLIDEGIPILSLILSIAIGYNQKYNYLKEKLIPNKMTYIFLDESQNVDQFPKVLDSLYIKDNVDIYVTGSNAYMLSSEIATMISRRYIQIEMLPLSFKEYMESTGNMNDRGIKYTEYLQNSSFPYALQLKNQPDEIRDTLKVFIIQLL